MQRSIVLHAAILQAQQEVCRMLSFHFGLLEQYANHPGQSYCQFLYRSPDGTVWTSDTAKRGGETIFGYMPLRKRGRFDAFVKRMLGRHIDFVEHLPNACATPGQYPGHSEWAWIPDQQAPETNQQRMLEIVQHCEVRCAWQRALNMLISHFDSFIVPMLAAIGAEADDYAAADEAIKFAWNELQIRRIMPPGPIPNAEALLLTIRDCFASCASKMQRPARGRIILAYVTQTQLQ